VNWFGAIRTATGGVLRHKVQAVVLAMVLLVSTASATLGGVTAAAGPFAEATVQLQFGGQPFGQLVLAGRASPGGSVDDLVLNAGHWPDGRPGSRCCPWSRSPSRPPGRCCPRAGRPAPAPPRRCAPSDERAVKRYPPRLPGAIAWDP
jgi:hypothetical protein